MGPGEGGSTFAAPAAPTRIMTADGDSDADSEEDSEEDPAGWLRREGRNSDADGDSESDPAGPWQAARTVTWTASGMMTRTAPRKAMWKVARTQASAKAESDLTRTDSD